MFAVIFDLDGVISDTQTLHATVESEILAELGITMTPGEITDRYAGTSDDALYTDVFVNHPSKTPYPPLEDIIERKWQLTHERAAGNITEMPNAIALIRTVANAGYKVAVASASPHEFIDLVLKSLDIEHYFPVRASSEDVTHGKPAPDVFLLAAKQLGIAPENCLVIEDGKSGMMGAKAAGMHCIGLVSDTSRTDYQADTLVEDLKEITPELLQELFSQK